MKHALWAVLFMLALRLAPAAHTLPGAIGLTICALALAGMTLPKRTR